MQTSYTISNNTPLIDLEEEEQTFWLERFKSILPKPVICTGYLPSTLACIDENGPLSL